jgi:hypothetical protein
MTHHQFHLRPFTGRRKSIIIYFLWIELLTSIDILRSVSDHALYVGVQPPERFVDEFAYELRPEGLMYQAIAKRHITSELRAAYDHLIQQPIPERLSESVAKLDQAGSNELSPRSAPE